MSRYAHAMLAALMMGVSEGSPVAQGHPISRMSLGELESEYHKIQRKVSKLSARARALVVRRYERMAGNR